MSMTSLAFTHGVYAAVGYKLTLPDGTVRNAVTNHVNLNHPKLIKDSVMIKSSESSALLLPEEVDNKSYIPYDKPLSDKFNWFEGYAAACATFHGDGPKMVEIWTTQPNIAHNLQILLVSMGLLPDVYGPSKDVTGHQAGHQWVLRLGSADVNTLHKNGFGWPRAGISMPLILSGTIAKQRLDDGEEIDALTIRDTL